MSFVLSEYQSTRRQLRPAVSGHVLAVEGVDDVHVPVLHAVEVVDGDGVFVGIGHVKPVIDRDRNDGQHVADLQVRAVGGNDAEFYVLEDDGDGADTISNFLSRFK